MVNSSDFLYAQISKPNKQQLGASGIQSVAGLFRVAGATPVGALRLHGRPQVPERARLAGAEGIRRVLSGLHVRRSAHRQTGGWAGVFSRKQFPGAGRLAGPGGHCARHEPGNRLRRSEQRHARVGNPGRALLPANRPSVGYNGFP